MKQSNIEVSVGTFVLLGIVAIVWFAVQAGAGVAVGGSTYEVDREPGFHRRRASRTRG